MKAADANQGERATRLGLRLEPFQSFLLRASVGDHELREEDGGLRLKAGIAVGGVA
ncbi:hypothetical protein [Singulisphaera sp. PoT]|uniref:hypothetical protein n=1 Tax=Singulisphaera sp. PoT TaxID=3411797 RepID=UPI003BF618F8